VPVAVGAPDNGPAQFDAVPGTVTVATAVDSRWSLHVGEQSLDPRPAFGATTGYDVAAGGAATLQYHTAISRAFLLVAQLVVWLALALGVSRFDTATLVRRRRRRQAVGPEAPLLSIDAPILAPVGLAGDEAVGDPGQPALASIGDETVSWLTEPEPGELGHGDLAHRDVDQSQAGVE